MKNEFDLYRLNGNRNCFFVPDPCAKIKCPFQGETCYVDRRNRPKCACLPRCPPLKGGRTDPVCGSDGYTYFRGLCDLNRAACKLAATINPVNKGRCSGLYIRTVTILEIRVTVNYIVS